MELPSDLLQKAVEQLNTLPGVGKKTALRFALNLLQREREEVLQFTEAVQKMRDDIKFCRKCHNISDNETCDICNDRSRNEELICVVEDMRDIIAIENTQQFNGYYHVLGGHISPMDGIGPNDLNISSLIHRVEQNEIKEVLLALSATMEGDTTSFYLYRKLGNFNVNLTTIARGVSVGDELEYADEITLGRSIVNRTPYTSTLSR